MKVSLLFSSIQDLLRIIKFIKDQNVGASINYSNDISAEFFEQIIELDINNLEIILNDMASDIRNFDGIFKYILGGLLNNIDSYEDIQNINLIIDKVFNAGYVPRLNMMGDEFRLLILYKKTQNKRLLQFIIDNLDIFEPDLLLSNTFIGTLVKNVDRETFYKTFDDFSDDLKAKYLRQYDNAVKKRVTDISLGLGYAQFDNQAQSNIPSLLLQQIVNESLDTSGLPAQDVYKIVKHVNEGTTNKTVRLGQPSNFADAYAQDDDSHDEDVIEI